MLNALIGAAAAIMITNPQARNEILTLAKKAVGSGIDLLNKAGGVSGDNDVPQKAE